MATPHDWDALLETRYVSFNVEIEAFIDSLDVANSVDVSIDIIYQAIKNNTKVSEGLKALYKEAIYGTNKEVKKRIHNRVTNFKRQLK